jgi:hypothetical protein
MAYGTVNADVIGTSVAGSNLGAGNASIMKNRIINGAMTISQYNGTSTVTPLNQAYVIDRWQAELTQASKFTTAQSSTAPTGFANSLLITSSSAYNVISTDQFDIRQKIEGFNTYDLGFGTANAKTITLSFWVYCSITGTFGGSLGNSAGNRSYPFNYTVLSANTWTQISITIAGDTSGTWIGATNGVGLIVYFSLGSGSTLSGTANTWQAGLLNQPTSSTSLLGTNGATLYITGVQLEVGSSATGYEYRMYQQELALCQRYYEKQSTTGSGGSQADFGSGIQNSTTSGYFYTKFNVTKRTAPTASFSNVLITDHTTYGTAATLSSIGKGYDSALLYATMSASGAQYRPAFLGVADNTVAYVDFSAEL